VGQDGRQDARHRPHGHVARPRQARRFDHGAQRPHAAPARVRGARGRVPAVAERADPDAGGLLGAHQDPRDHRHLHLGGAEAAREPRARPGLAGRLAQDAERGAVEDAQDARGAPEEARGQAHLDQAAGQARGRRAVEGLLFVYI